MLDITHLSENALIEELNIRNIDSHDIEKAKRILRKNLRDELKDESLRPSIVENHDEEFALLEYELNLLRDMVNSKKANPRSVAVSRLLYLEYRLSYTRIHQIQSEILKRQFFDLAESIETLRAAHFDKESRIVVRTVNSSEESCDDTFTDENEQELSSVTQKLNELRNKKSRASNIVCNVIEIQSGSTLNNERQIGEDLVDTNEDDGELYLSLHDSNSGNFLESNINDLPLAMGGISISRPQNTVDVSNVRKTGTLSKRKVNSFPTNVDSNSRPFSFRSTTATSDPSTHFSQLNNNSANTQSNEVVGLLVETLRNLNVNNRRSPQHESRMRPMEIGKWPYSFHGKCDGSVIVFIKDVEIMAQAQGISNADLLRSVSVLFKGYAADWYRVQGHKALNWSHFKTAMKDEFLHDNFDYHIQAEIRSTKMKSSETFKEFVTRMEMVFMKLSYEIRDSEKLEHLKQSVRREYLDNYTRRVSDLKEFISLCNTADSHSNKGLFSERENSSGTNDNRFKSFNPQRKIFSIENETESTASEACDTSDSTLHFETEYQRELCELNRKYNVNGSGHGEKKDGFKPKSNNSQQMKPRHGLICYHCKTEGYTKSNCPKCRADPVKSTRHSQTQEN